MAITWEDFEKVKMHAGTILDVMTFPEARKPAYKLKIDLGILGIKWSSAQITDLYKPAELIGKQVVVVTSFPKKQIANFISECLVLGVVNSSNEVALLTVDRPVINGDQVA
jgi:tRNA-binding protein